MGLLQNLGSCGRLIPVNPATRKGREADEEHKDSVKYSLLLHIGTGTVPLPKISQQHIWNDPVV